MEKVADGVWLLRGDLAQGDEHLLPRGRGRRRAVRRRHQGDDEEGAGGGRAARRAEAGRARTRPRRPPGHGARDGRAGLLPRRRSRRRRKRRGDRPYMDLSQLPAPARWIYPLLLRRWDGGAVKIDGTVAEGDEVAGFRVLHFPGHAPGLIGLWRESDRVAIVSDVVYLIDSTKLGRAAAAGRGERPPPRLGLGSRQGEGVGAQAGGAGAGGRLRRARRAAARREPARDAGAGGGEVLSRGGALRPAAIVSAPDDRDLRLGGADLRRLAAGGTRHPRPRGRGRVARLAGARGRLRRRAHGHRLARAGAGARDQRDRSACWPWSSPRRCCSGGSRGAATAARCCARACRSPSSSPWSSRSRSR